MSTISASTTSTTAYKVTADTTGTLVLQTGSTPTTAMTIDASQNVGVGVTPSAWGTYKAFQLNSAGYSMMGGTSGAIFGALGVNYYFDGTNYKYINASYATQYNQSAGAHTWSTAGIGSAGANITFTQAMTLDASGNLSNTGNITSGTFTKATSYVWASGSGTAGGYYLGIGSDNGRICQASAGAASTPTYIGTQQITTSSDVRLKDNIVDTQRNALELIGQLRVVDHTWNDPSDQCETNKNSRGVWMGLIAQEAQPIIPWLVNKPKADVDEDGNPQYWFMDYGYSVPFLIKAIQEQQALITSQSEIINAQQATLTQLTSRIEALEAK